MRILICSLWRALRVLGFQVKDLLRMRVDLVGKIGSLILISSSWATLILMGSRVYCRSKLESSRFTSRGMRLRLGYGPLRLKASQSISLKKSWFLMSWMPPAPMPNRLAGSIYSRRSRISLASPWSTLGITGSFIVMSLYICILFSL